MVFCIALLPRLLVRQFAVELTVAVRHREAYALVASFDLAFPTVTNALT